MTIDADLEEFAETFTGADFTNTESRSKLESVIISVAQKVAHSEWKGPVTETLKLLKIGIEKLIKSKPSVMNSNVHADGKSLGERRDNHPEPSFFSRFGARMFCFLASGNSIEPGHREEALGILQSLVAMGEVDESLGLSHHQDVLLDISWILKETTRKIWQEQKLNLSLQLVEPEKMVVILKENQISNFPTWLIDLWAMIAAIRTENSWVLSTIAFETPFIEDLTLSAITLLKIDIASDFNLIQSQRPWIEFLHCALDYLAEETCLLIGNLLITWISKGIKIAMINTSIDIWNNLDEALSNLIEKKSFTISKLSEITHVYLSLDQNVFTHYNVLLKIVQVLAVKGLCEDYDLACFLHIVRMASTQPFDSSLITNFSALLSNESNISSIKSRQCLEQYFHYIEDLTLNSNFHELKYHLAILQKIDGDSRKLISKYASECICSIEKARSSKDIIVEQELFLTLNFFFPHMIDIFPECLEHFNRKFVLYSVLFLSPSYLTLIHKYYPDEFININAEDLRRSSNSFRASIYSVMNGIEVIQKFTQLSLQKEMLDNQQLMPFLKSLTQHAFFWENIQSFMGWDIQFELTDWLVETRLTSQELLYSVSSAICRWGCFLSGSRKCASIKNGSNECHSNSSDLLKIPNTQEYQANLKILLQYVEKIWNIEFNDHIFQENLVMGIIRVYKHSSFNLSLSNSFLNSLFKLHMHTIKRIRNLCRYLYPLLLQQTQSLDIWKFSKQMLLESLNADELWMRESGLSIIKHLMVEFAIEENQIFEDCFLILFDHLSSNDSIIRSFVLEQLLSCPDRIFEPLLEKAIIRALETPDKSLRSLKDLSLLMNMPFNTFLEFSFPYILPIMIYSRNDSLLHSLISRGKDVNPTKVAKKLILFSGDIIAYLILNSSSYDDIFQHYLSLVQPYSGELSVESVFRSNALMLVYNLVIELGGESKSKAETAIRSVAKELSGSSMPNTTGFLTAFLIQHSLGIISRLQDVLHNVGIVKPRSLKIKIAKAMKVYIGLLGDNVSRIASQVLGLLKLLLEFTFLWSPTLDAWFCFVKALPSKVLDEFFRQITVYLLGLEKKMTHEQRHKVISIFEFLIFERETQLQHHFVHMPDFPNDLIWSKISEAVSKRKSSEITFVSTLNIILEMLSQDNASLISQVLIKLKALLEENQNELEILLLGEEINPTIKKLIQKLIKLVNQYHVDDRYISTLCGDCLGSLGAIDPSRLKIAFDSEAFFDASLSLNDPDDILNFSCLLIEKHLVVAFKATQGPKLQACISYTIQELLRFCGFTMEIVTEATQIQPQTKVKLKQSGKHDLKRSLIEKWRSFPVSILSTLEPLLSSKYYVEPVHMQKNSHPIFEPKLTYSQWAKRLFLDLMCHAPSVNSLKIFELCSCMIDHGDIATAQLLLPHLITNILVSETNNEDLVKEFCHILLIDSGEESAHLREQHGLCLQMIFRLVDHISKRASICRLRYGRIKSRSSNPSPAVLAAIVVYENEFKSLEKFLSQIPQSMIASAAIRSRAYARSLMHYENYFREERKIKSHSELQSLYVGLQKIYAELEDADALSGISNYIVNQSIENQILGHEVAGRWSSAQSCYEVLHQSEPTPQHQNGILKCLQNMGHYESILMYGEGMIQMEKSSQFNSECRNYLIGASWRMSNWSRVENLLQNRNNETFDATIGRLLVHLASKNYSKFKELLSDAKASLINPLAAAGMESYQRSFEFIMQLAQLTDIETIYAWFLSNSKKSDTSFESEISKLAKIWNTRLKTASPSYRESFLTLQRVLMGILAVDKFDKNIINCQIGKLWIQTAKETRKICHFQTSFSAILQSVRYNAADIEIQQAKLLWNQSFHHQAMDHLKLFVERNTGKTSNNDFLRKARLLLCSWKEITGEVISSALTLEYTQLTKDFPSWEKAQFYLGRYFYRIYEFERKHSSNSSKTTAQSAHTVIMICRQYLKCLSIGSKYLYQAMPKFLSLWLDLAASALNKNSVLASDFSKVAEKTESINLAIRKFIPKLSAFQYLTALPQILSRIAHPSKGVQECLDLIITIVLNAYPQQALWHLMAVAKSASPARVQRVSAIFTNMRSSHRNTDMLAKIQHAEKLTDGFLSLCNFPVSKEKTKLSMLQDFRNLVNLVSSTNIATIIPLQACLIPSVPIIQAKEVHRPFASDLPYMTGLEDQIDIMASLQRPRRFGIKGTDGKTYYFLAKPDDDLRKDSRLMEFNGIVNRLFKKENEARKRNLQIRTYAVIPLNEKCGLIEWIPNLQGFRAIVMKAYKERNIYYPVGQIKQIMDVKGVQPKVKAFLELVSKYPPVFYTWFLESFPEPAKWLSSRSAYISTIAAMSMVGHVVGLGDRHGENILFDELTGECMHVDLNCLFEKGKTFEIPERVPFRLTHNMVDAFGITGVDGAFKNACEISMGVLRNNRELLKSVLEAFLHDPCLNERGSSPATASKMLARIGDKLEGLMEDSNISVNVQGQVEALINEASRNENLAQMYIGWAPYL